MEFIHINLRRLTQTLHNYLIEYHLSFWARFRSSSCPSLNVILRIH